MNSRPYSLTTQDKLKAMLADLPTPDLLGFVREHLPKRAKELLAAELKTRTSPKN